MIYNDIIITTYYGGGGGRWVGGLLRQETCKALS